MDGQRLLRNQHVTAAFDVNQLDFPDRAADWASVMGRW
jgi:hypothetical protein